MVTEQKLTRSDLALQRISDNYFEATVTLKKYNSLNETKKLMAEYTKLKSTKEYVDYLERKELIVKPIKTHTVHGTWMHPYIYIDFCMWLSVEFKSLAIQMVLDGLVKMRHSAGDYYIEMCNTIKDNYFNYYKKEPTPMVYINEANIIREIAGVSEKDRNEMTEKELKRISLLQKANIELITNKVGKQARIKQLEFVSKLI
jgi:KilA-N domain